MSIATDLIDQIDAYLAHTGMGKTRLGVLATGDGCVIDRIRTGRATIKTANRVRDFITQHPDGFDTAPSDTAA